MGVPRFLILWSLPRTQVTADFPCANRFGRCLMPVMTHVNSCDVPESRAVFQGRSSLSSVLVLRPSSVLSRSGSLSRSTFSSILCIGNTNREKI